MADKKSNALHNLKGWIRDVRHVLKEQSETAYELAELIDDVLGIIDAPAMDAAGDDGAEDDEAFDDANNAIDGDSAEVDSRQLELRSSSSGGPQGPAARSADDGTEAGRLERLVDVLAGALRVPPEHLLEQLRVDPVGPPQRRLSGIAKVVTDG